MEEAGVVPTTEPGGRALVATVAAAAAAVAVMTVAVEELGADIATVLAFLPF